MPLADLRDHFFIVGTACYGSQTETLRVFRLVLNTAHPSFCKLEYCRDTKVWEDQVGFSAIKIFNLHTPQPGFVESSWREPRTELRHLPGSPALPEAAQGCALLVRRGWDARTTPLHPCRPSRLLGAEGMSSALPVQIVAAL